MRTLVYIDGPAVSGALEEWAEGQEGHVEWRNGQYFESPERRVDRVVTEMDEVRDAYESKDVEVVGMPSATSSSKASSATSSRYIAEDAGRWKKIRDTETGEYVDGESKRSMQAAQKRVDELNNS